ncbi:MAG: carboxypeptidase-like regulatory domain-containing protein, partial [Sphingobacteriales bacterium]
MIKYFSLTCYIILLSMSYTFAQSGREVSGTVIDSTKLTVPGTNVKLTSDQGDSTVTAADANGKFIFPNVKGDKIRLTLSSIGYQTLIKRFSLGTGTEPIALGSITIPNESTQLSQVTIVGAAVPVRIKEDTVEYNVSSYKVRDNAPIEDVLRKLPGMDVDKDGNVTAQGQQVTKVRLNGKDYYGGDLKAATKNLPADIIENIQIVDDYGDQANLTGIRTGESTKILNINTRKDKNYGYTLQATAGDGTDALPKDEGIPNENRYIGTLNYFKFRDDQQISVLGSLNNTNVNTFSFSAPTGGGFGGNFGGGGGGGGRGNAFRGGSSGQTTNANGITDAKSIGINFRDEIGKK